MAKPTQGNRKVNPFRRIEMITLEAPPHPTSCHVGNVTYIYELRATNYEVPEAERSEAARRVLREVGSAATDNLKNEH